MGKDKKESKKGPPLLTSAQSDAYKEILGVFFKQHRNKARPSPQDRKRNWTTF